jgi:hypothetical protein
VRGWFWPLPAAIGRLSATCKPDVCLRAPSQSPTATVRENVLGSPQEIRDEALLGALVFEAITTLGAGSEKAAAAATGIDRSVLNRLRPDHNERRLKRKDRGLKGKPLRLSHATAAKLEAVAHRLGVEWHRKFLRALGADMRRRRFYVAWLRERMDRWATRRGPHPWVNPEEVPAWPGKELLKGPRARFAREHLRRVLSGSLQAFVKENLPKTHQKLLDFEDWAVHRAQWDRTEMAWIRIIEPLLEHNESGFVEPSWIEFPPAKLAEFLEAGFRRERILLEVRGDEAGRLRMARESGASRGDGAR